MINLSLHRTTNTPPLAVLRHSRGDTLVFPWSDLLGLRELVSSIPPEAMADENYPRQENGGPWAIEGTPFGIALLRPGERVYFRTPEWQALQGLLYVGDDLMSQTEVAALVGLSQQRVWQAIAMGDLFAFQRPGYKRRQWLIPRRAAEDWASKYGT